MLDYARNVHRRRRPRVSLRLPYRPDDDLQVSSSRTALHAENRRPPRHRGHHRRTAAPAFPCSNRRKRSARRERRETPRGRLALFAALSVS
ncbi:MAG: hypothetical protein ACLT98_13230 [Eggerthellaceae bacterium]